MASPLDSLVIRPGVPDDWNRVRKDWKESFKSSARAKDVTPPELWKQNRASQVYWDWQGEVVDRLLRTAQLEVASWGEDARSIVGWCCTEAGVVHYVYVGYHYRHMGVAARLLAPFAGADGIVYTHRARSCDELPIPESWLYDPRPALGPFKEAA